MDATPQQLAEQLLEGRQLKQVLGASEFEDVIYHLNRKLDGESGFQLLVSPQV